MILVIGSSGYIGNNIYKELVKEKFDVVGTYFKNKLKGLVYFDICSMVLPQPMQKLLFLFIEQIPSQGDIIFFNDIKNYF